MTAKFESVVPADFIGKSVMDGLREIDEVAYVRFASVVAGSRKPPTSSLEVQKLEAAK